MRIVFFSNYLSPHQRPFSEEMFKLMGDNYVFVSCEAFSVSRKNMGWGELEKQPYELRPYESKTDYDRAMELAENSDVMLWGSTKYEFIKIRIKSGRISIRYSERLFKKGFISSIISLDLLRQIKFSIATRTKSSYLFCASAFSPFDFMLSLGRFKKMYKWGYYPKTLYYDVDRLMNKKSDSQKISILWAGRFLKLKHPEIAVHLADSLKKRGIDFSMKIIGSGELEQEIKDSINSRQLSEYIEMLGSMTPEEVRKHMENSDLFLFSSDFNEGWGAVMNESLNSGCVVMCSEEVGSAHYLIEHGKNGFLFNRKNLEELVEIVISLSKNPFRRREIGIKAYETIAELWSEKVAAERFYLWACGLIRNEDIQFQEGPMSQAKLNSTKEGLVDTMKILQINGVIHQGSTGKIVDAITDYARSCGDNCTIAYGIGCNTGDGFKFCYRYEQALYRRCSMITGYRYGFAPLATKRLLHFIEGYKPDVVHLHSINGNCVNIFDLLAFLKVKNIPTVVTNHAEFFYTGNCTSTYGCTKYIGGCRECSNTKWASDSAVFPKTESAWRKMKKAFADFKNMHIVCVSDHSISRSIISPILGEYNHSVIFNGVDTDIFRPVKNIDVRKKYHLTAKKIALFVTPVFSMDKEHLKGGYWLVELSKKYREEEWQFLVVGNNGINVNQGNLLFAGVIHDRNLLANIYSQVDVVLGFSKSESFGMTCAEALCCGTPFIGFKCGGTESIAIKEFSRFTEYGDLNLMASYMEEIVNTMKGQQDYISNIARNHYSDYVMAKKYYDLYKKCINNNLENCI